MKSVPAKQRWAELTAAVIQLGKNQRILEARIAALERERDADIEMSRRVNAN
jgi:hypothetical protein